MGISPGPSQPVKALQYLVKGNKVSLALVFLFLVYFLFSPALRSRSLLLPRGDLPFSYLFLSHFMLQWRFIGGVKFMICHDSPTSPAELRVESSICAKLCTPSLFHTANQRLGNEHSLHLMAAVAMETQQCLDIMVKERGAKAGSQAFLTFQMDVRCQLLT